MTDTPCPSHGPFEWMDAQRETAAHRPIAQNEASNRHPTAHRFTEI